MVVIFFEAGLCFWRRPKNKKGFVFLSAFYSLAVHKVQLRSKKRILHPKSYAPGYAFGADRKSEIFYPFFRPLAVHKVQLRGRENRILHPKSYARIAGL